ncbi:MAG TPA: hypothetical protein VJP76_05935, partial [Candidatus Tumulicola sp.]|nr:hypothetical protein [Candidatus Tumulicola sp.]
MVRFGRLAAALSVALLAVPACLVARPAAAQVLQRLTVQSFELASDSTRPQVDVPFHLLVTVRVRERVSEIDNLELPVLAQLELLGDERALQSGTGGTLYRETITLVAHQPGDVTIAPAILQAIDPSDKRAKQYYSNGLTLHVVAAPGQAFAQGARDATSILRFVLHVAIWVLGIACAAALLVLLFRKRPVSAPAVVETPAAPAAPPAAAPLERSPRDRLLDALTVLRAERSRAAAVRVRAVVWESLGASEGETLADVLGRPQAADPQTRELLVALERAAFTH